MLAIHERPQIRADHEDQAAIARCRRLATGLREPDVEALLDLPSGAVAAWEEQRAPVPANVLDTLDEITAAAAAQTATLIEQAAQTGRIETFADDAMTVAATQGTITHAVVHRSCAGRASAIVPDALVVLLDEDGDERDGWMAATTVAHGMGLAYVRKWFDVPRRAAQYWLTGARQPPEGVITELRSVVAQAREHVDELASSVDEDGTVWVCATEDQMEHRWPQRHELPLPTHQVCAARAAAADPAVRLAYVVE